jgi:hypothetical protein
MEAIMTKRTLALIAGLLAAGLVVAADPPQQVYGSQLMTQQERAAYRSKMRAAKTAEEKAQIRAEHHEQMKLRAKELGVTLPDTPPATGGGMGPGGGMGMGAGPNR